MQSSERAASPSGAPASPVMLALSTFRRAESTVHAAIQKAGACGRLVVVYVVDINLARYFIGSDIGVYPRMKQQCEADLLKEYEQKARAEVEAICEKARAAGLSVASHVRVGRFALICLEIVAREKPSLIVTRRSRRPEWVKKFFGSPVDHLIAHAGCPVVEA